MAARGTTYTGAPVSRAPPPRPQTYQQPQTLVREDCPKPKGVIKTGYFIAAIIALVIVAILLAYIWFLFQQCRANLYQPTLCPSTAA